MNQRSMWILLYTMCIPALFIFFWMYSIAQTDGMTGFDSTIFSFFNAISGDVMVQVAKGVTIVGNKPTIIVGALLLLCWLWFKRKNYLGLAILALGVGGGNYLKNWLKEYVGRERPETALLAEEELAFPSGHAMISLVFYVLLAYFIAKEVQSRGAKITIYVTGILIAFLSGTSRIILHVHYPSDVIGGYALGFALLMLCLFLYRRYESKFPK
ncbi:phosphatase PAP2 family protein [Bacillus carboniphilus]|uniref:Phosphatase PAP2 family protein n=1 Tax=Bacillus carboniphilus TaxID=86663 RepID=A0ABN0VPM2_9BACI